MPDPATETDRALLDRLLPRWSFVRAAFDCVRVQADGFRGFAGHSDDAAIRSAAAALRAILARDRETRGEAKPETPVLRRVLVNIITYANNGNPYFVGIDNEGNTWHANDPMCGPWHKCSSLPQPGEEGSE